MHDRECFPTYEQAVDWTWASSTEENEALDFVLRKFFTLEDGVYKQLRIQQELHEFSAQCEANSINGKKGGRPKKVINEGQEEPKLTQPLF